MSRWINADAIEDKAKQYSLGYYEEDEWAVPFKEINSAPSIDICFCRECKYWQKSREYYVMCCMRERPNRPMKADDFCSYGERKGE